MTAAEAIVLAAKSLHTVRIEYQDEKGQSSSREIEPYSFRSGKDPGSVRIFGHDLSRNETRGFRMDRISLAEVTENTYIPRWTVEL